MHLVTLELGAFSNGLAQPENLNQILDLFPEHLRLIREGLLIETPNLCAVYPVVLQVSLSDKMTLGVSDIFLALTHEELLGLWLMVVLQLGSIKYQTI